MTPGIAPGDEAAMIATEPPASVLLPALDRRTLLKGGALGAGLIAAPLSAQLGERGFTHGVASGEPGQDRVLLWTRFAAAQDTRLGWQVSKSLDLARIAADGEAVAAPERDFCGKAWAEGLAPGTWYYYRFTAPDGSVSDIGRTRTLPGTGAGRFRLAVFSCANIGSAGSMPTRMPPRRTNSTAPRISAIIFTSIRRGHIPRPSKRSPGGRA